MSSLLGTINKIYVINKLFGFHKKRKKLNKRERFSQSIEKIRELNKKIKYSKNLDTINKGFDYIKQELLITMKNRPLFEEINFNEHIFKKHTDLFKVDIIREKYIKAFLLERIEIELRKSESVNSSFTKDKYLRKALYTAVQAVEYVPNDCEMLYKITELEQMVEDQYNNKNKAVTNLF